MAETKTKNKPQREKQKGIEISVFPHVLLRVAGGSFEELEKLNAPQSCELLEEIESLRGQLSAEKETLCDELHKLIGASLEIKKKLRLINVRRDLFNERPIKACNLPYQLNSKFSNYIKIQAQVTTLLKKGELIFEKEASQSRKHLRKLAQNEMLRKGLLLSSQSLLKRLDKYMQTPDDKLSKGERSTEKSLLKYITRMYAKTSPFSTFTNLAMGEISDDLLQEKFYSFETVGDKAPKVVSHIRLNNYLFAYLKGLITKHNDIRRYFRLRPNPTLKQEESGQYVFLTNSNNVEAFQRIPANPVLEVFRYVASERNEGVSLQQMVATILENEYIDAPAEDLEAYIVQLLEYGFLEYNLGVSGTDPDWDKKLRKALAPVAAEIELIAELNKMLAKVREYAETYSTAPVEKRQLILTQVHKLFRNVCMKIHKDAGLPADERKTQKELIAEARQKREKEKKLKAEGNKEKKQEIKQSEDTEKEASKEFKRETSTYFYFNPEQIFYEDTALEAKPYLNDSLFKNFVSILHDALQGMKLFEGRLEEKDRMLHFFRKKYRKGTGSIELLKFYENYYREVKKPEEEKEAEKRKAQQNQKIKQNKGTPAKLKKSINRDNKLSEEQGFPVPSIKMRIQQREAWLNRFQSTVKRQANGAQNPEQVNLSFDQICKANAKELNKNSLKEDGNSFAMFIQYYKQTGVDGQEKLMGVLNASLPGFGKMYSRFLHLYEEVTDDMRKWNLALAGEKLFLEDSDASYFNANLHPPLMPYEIWMPEGHNSLSPEQQIPVTDLQVFFDKENNELKLIHKTSGKQMNVFDLGFQGHTGRSPLYLLLESFTAVEYLGFYPMITSVNNHFNNNGTPGHKKKQRTFEVQVYPRIIYENQIVLRRKTWFVPKSLLPFKKTSESDWSYFSRINWWRLEQNIPDEVFVFINPNRDNQQAANENPEAYKKLGRDDYKPQYICFKNPMLLSLFENMLQRVPEFLKIEEMLPNSQELIEVGDGRRVTESVVQWYTNISEEAVNG